MPYRNPPSKAQLTAFQKTQSSKDKTPAEKIKIRDAFRKKFKYYATDKTKEEFEKKDEKSRIFGAFQIAEIRQLVKAHNRINDLVLPRKLNKQQIIDLIYSKGYRLDPDKRSIVQIRRPTKRSSEVTMRTAMDKKNDPDSSKRTTYSKKVK